MGLHPSPVGLMLFQAESVRTNCRTPSCCPPESCRITGYGNPTDLVTRSTTGEVLSIEEENRHCFYLDSFQAHSHVHGRPRVVGREDGQVQPGHDIKRSGS